MPKQLPGAWSLITESWSAFRERWNETFKVSIWFLYFGLVSFAGALLVKVSGSEAMGLFNGLLAILVAIGYVWAAIRLIQAVLELEAGRKISIDQEASYKAAKLILPLFWVNLLSTVVILGGFLLLIVPGFYLCVALMFSQLIRIDEGRTGFQALAASRALIKGRWWATLWRWVAGNFTFGICFGLGLAAIFLVLALVAGGDALSNGAFETDPLLRGAEQLLQSVVQAATLPLFVTFQVKLYKALKATQEKAA